MRAMLDYLTVTGPIADKSIFVAQRAVRPRDPEDCGRRERARLDGLVAAPYDPFLYLKAVNEGIPVVVDAPRSAPGERLVKLSQMAFGADSSVAPAMTESKRTAGLFRRRR